MSMPRYAQNAINNQGQNGGGSFNPFSGFGGLGSSAGGAIGTALGGLFSDWNNPADAAMPGLNRIPGMMKPYYDPYIKAGNNALPQLQGQYDKLLSNPGGRLNEIGGNFQQSPGFQFALQQALQGAGHAAAAGGMAGSPQHEQQNMQLATNMGNQDYNQWLQHAVGMYGQGMQGEQDLSHLGYGASNEYAQSLGNTELQKALMQYLGTSAQNEHDQGMWGALGSGIGSLIWK